MKNIIINQKEFDKKILNNFKTNNVSLYCYFDHLDRKKIGYKIGRSGHVFLCSSNISSKMLRIEFLLLYNHCYSAYYDKKLLKLRVSNYDKNILSGEAEIIKFDGELPVEYSLTSIPLNVANFKNYIIEYVAAGYCPKVNPNLISSWGYQIVD